MANHAVFQSKIDFFRSSTVPGVRFSWHLASSEEDGLGFRLGLVSKMGRLDHNYYLSPFNSYSIYDQRPRNDLLFEVL